MCPAGNRSESLSSVDGNEKAGSHRVDSILIGRIDSHSRVIKTPRDYSRFFGNLSEGFAAIVGAIKRSLLGFNNRIDDIGVAGRDSYANASEHLWQAITQFVPGSSAIN